MHVIRRGRVVGLAALLCAVAAIVETSRDTGTVVPTPARAAVTIRATASAPPPACPSAVRGLGRIAYVARGQLDVVDLSSCRVRRVTAGGAWSPQFSPDGRWLAYSHGRLVYAQGPPDHSGSPVVVPAGGGPARSPLGAGVRVWWWVPSGATLDGVNHRGQLVHAVPDGHARVAAGGARTFADPAGASPDGRDVATDTSRCIPDGFTLATVAVRSGTSRAAVIRATGQATFAGWSPDARWLLYWTQPICSASIAADGRPLDVARSGGSRPRQRVRAVGHVLLFPDYLTWCGSRLIAASTPSRETQLGSKLVATGPPAWHQRTIVRASHLSWVSPTCDPSGSLLAAAAGRSSTNAGFGLQHRSIWLLTPAGKQVRRLTTPPASDLSDEAPAFSRDGRWLLFVRTRIVTVGTTNFSRDTLELVPAQRTGPAATISIASFTSNDFSFYDHFSWPSEIAWSGGAR